MSLTDWRPVVFLIVFRRYIDYDALALTPGLDIPAECDQTQFDSTSSEAIITAGVQLAARLKKVASTSHGYPWRFCFSGEFLCNALMSLMIWFWMITGTQVYRYGDIHLTLLDLPSWTQGR